MQKKVALILVAVLLMANLVAVAEFIGITPFYTNTDAVGAGLSISSSGVATCTGFVEPSSTTAKSKVVVNLQRYEGGSWKTLASWSKTASNGGTAATSGTLSVKSGYSYRVLTNGTVMDSSGKVLETTSCTSATKNY